MNTAKLLRAVTLTALALAAGAAMAGGPTVDDYENAYGKAAKLEQQALADECAWTVTEDALKASKAAAGKQDYVTAVAQAKRAEELAGLSLKQAAEQRTAWHSAVVK